MAKRLANSPAAVKTFTRKPGTGGSPLKRERRAAELAIVRGLNDGAGPQTLNAEMAKTLRASVFVFEIMKNGGDVRAALRVLGLPVDGSTDEELRAMVEAECATTYARRELSRQLARLEGARERIIATLEDIMLTGDDDQRLKAAAQLAKMGGHNAATKVQLDARSTSLTLHSFGELVKNDEKFAAFNALTNHEPGEAVAVTVDDERVRALQARDED